MNFKIYFFLLINISFIYSKRLSNKQIKIINISFSINNNYAENLLVPLISLFENANKNTIYHVHILVGESFKEENYHFLYDLEKNYFNCYINIINVGNDFKDVYKSFLDEAAYYRLKIPTVCPNINRMIYLDSDTIILKDLNDFYSLNFNGNYILGKLDKYSDSLDKLNIYILNYINTGVLLIDLYSLRKYGYVGKFMKYIQEHNNNKYLHRHDQTLINYICHDKIGILHPKFHMWPFKDENHLLKDHIKLRIPYKKEDLLNGYYNAYIIHFPGGLKYRESLKNSTYYYKRYTEYLIKAENYRKNKTKII